MWPFGEKKPVATRLAAVPPGQPGAVAVLTSVVSENIVRSPVSGAASALLQVELLERIPQQQGSANSFGSDGSMHDSYVTLGIALFGDVLVLRDADGDEISVIASRARFEGAMPRSGGTLITRVPPELVPFLQRASGRGSVCYREHPLLAGDKVLLKAIVEASPSVVTAGYRSGSAVRYVARDDLGAVVLAEVFEAPGW